MFNEDFNYCCFKNEPEVLLDPDGVHAPRKPVNELRHQHRNVMRSLSGAIIKRHMDK